MDTETKKNELVHQRKEYTEKLQQLTSEKEYERKLEMFLVFLNEEPPAHHIDKTPDGKAKHIPIGFMEAALDEMYGGLWSVENFKYMVMANEITASLELKVFHPIAKEWITRAGTAAKPVRQKADSMISEMMDTKLKNALYLDLPNVKSEAIKNAAKTLGAKFGRGLNRKHEATYQPRLLVNMEKLKRNISAIELQMQELERKEKKGKKDE